MKPIATPSRTQEILNRHSQHAKKKFGQNFIIEPKIIERIVSASHLDHETSVIEVGPGLGALTEGLCQSAHQVKSFEIDEDMVQILHEELGEYENLEVIHQDFLKVDLQEVISQFDTKKLKVVANLPYYITSKLLEKIALEGDGISDVIVMVQKDVAIKMARSQELRDRLPLTLLLKRLGDVEILFDVPRNVFNPSPNVDSAILGIHLNQSLENRAGFYHFLQIAFQARRKTLINNLKSLNFNQPLERILDALGYPASVRAEAIQVEDLEYIFKQCTHSL